MQQIVYIKIDDGRTVLKFIQPSTSNHCLAFFIRYSTNIHKTLKMKLLLVICFVSLSSGYLYQNKGFANLIASLQDDDSIEMEDVLNSEEIYIKALSHKEDVIYSEIELLVGAEVEETADEEEEEDEENNSEPELLLFLRIMSLFHSKFHEL